MLNESVLATFKSAVKACDEKEKGRKLKEMKVKVEKRKRLAWAKSRVCKFLKTTLLF